jgi:hypothetical protein
MASSNKTKQIGLLVALAALSWGCGGGRDSTWDALLGAIPQKLSLQNLGETGNYYILRQTHEAVFRRDDGQHYSSRLLKSWSRSLDSRRYVFCPDTSLSFSPAAAFSQTFFEGYISSVTARFSPVFEIRQEGGCLAIQFPIARPGYLEFLSTLETAPSLPGLYGDSTGLGPYSVESISKSEVVLKRNKPAANGYDRIILHEYSGSSDPRLADRSVEDFNKLSSFDQPEWLSAEFRKFNNVELKSINLIINHPDPAVRRAVHDCLDVDAFRRAFAPKRKDFFDIQTVLPAGIPGGRPGRLAQACQAAGRRRFEGTALVLVNQKKDNLIQLAAFSKDFYAKTGIRIVLKNLTPQEISPLLKGGPRGHDYNLVLLVLDTVTPDYDMFFDYILGASATVDHVPRALTELYKKFRRAGRWDDRTEMAVEIADRLNQEALSLTLYQTIVPLYYPPGIRNLQVGRGFAQYPEVAEFRW